MAKDALARLFEDAMNSSNNQTSQYTIDDQLDIDDDFLGVMSDSSKDMLLSRIQKVELDDNELIEEPLEEPNNELQDFNEDIKSALDYNLVDESNEVSKKENITKDESLFGKVELNKIDEDDNEDDSEEEEEEKEEPVVEQKRGRGRPRKKPLEETEATKSSMQSTPKVSSNISSTEDMKSLNEFMDSLAKDLINELRESNYRTHNFNKKQMNVILDYIENKI